MSAQDVLGRVQADSWAHLLGGLIRDTGRPDLAEDALAEAFAQAVDQWAAQGVPRNPAGWLATVARRRLVDARRAEHRRAAPLLRAPQAARAAGAAP